MISPAVDEVDHAGLTRIAERLARPAIRIAPESFPMHWRQTDVCAVCRRPPSFDSGPTLGGRIRGALGHALASVAADLPVSAARRRALWGWPSAFAALFAAEWERGLVPPYAIFAGEEKGDIHIRVSLFGFAAIWTTEVKTALAKALAGGIALSPEAAVRIPLRIESINVEIPSMTPILPAREALLLLHGLFEIRNDRAMASSARAFAASLVNRMAALARWQDMEIIFDTHDFDASAIKISYEPPMPLGWTRRSSAQRGRRIPMIGSHGRMTLKGRIEPLLPFLRVGELAQIGGRTTFGYGRFELVLLP